MAKQQISQQKNWYVLHTYSGYEDAVAKSLKQRVESLGMEDKIFDVIVPKEKKIKIKNGKRKVVEEKIYPGYVLVEMIVTDDSWYVVRNTPNVTGFVGAGTTPVPISKQEIDILKILLFSLKQQIMTDHRCLSGRLICMEAPAVPLVFLYHLSYVLVVANLHTHPFFQYVLTSNTVMSEASWTPSRLLR